MENKSNVSDSITKQERSALFHQKAEIGNKRNNACLSCGKGLLQRIDKKEITISDAICLAWDEGSKYGSENHQDLEILSGNLKSILETISKRKDDLKTTLVETIKRYLKDIERLPVTFLYRFIDDDLRYDIVRIKMVFLKNGQLYGICSKFNRNGYAEDAYFPDDNCFDEDSEVLLEKEDVQLLDNLLKSIIFFEGPRYLKTNKPTIP